MFEDENARLQVPNPIKTCTELQAAELQTEASLVIPVVIHPVEIVQPTQQQTPNFNQLYSSIQNLAIIVIRNNGIVIYCNPTAKKMISSPRDCLIGENYKEFIKDFDNFLPKMEASPEKIIVSEQIKKVFVPYFDGSLIPCNITISTSLELGHQYRLISLQDLRHEKKVEAESEALAQRAKDLSTVAHELRAAVHGILGACELLNEHSKKLKDSADKEALDQIHNIFSASSTQLTDVTNAYLSGKRLPMNFNIKKIMEETYTILLGMQQKSNPYIKVLLDIPFLDNNEVHGDPLAIRQIILNIAGNAIKFTKAGEVRIGLAIEAWNTQSLSYKLWIQDTGPGLQEEQIKEIWKPRGNVHSTNHTKIKGTGLGLSITQDIVTQLEGRIDTQSAVGKGTTFTICFSLPLAKLEGNYTEHKKPNAVECARKDSTPEEDITVSSQSLPPLSPLNLSVLKRKILAVDDTKINLQILEQYFRNDPNYTLITANSGEKAIEYLQSNDYAAILLDQQMPGMSGLETAISLRNMGKNVPIIFTTGDTDQAWQKSLAEYQNISVLAKPCTKKDILNAINKAIEQSEIASQATTTHKKTTLLSAFDASKSLSAPLSRGAQQEQIKPSNSKQQKGEEVK